MTQKHTRLTREQTCGQLSRRMFGKTDDSSTCSSKGTNVSSNSLAAAAAATVVYHEDENTGAALELSECIAESLMDHFTERGLLAKEIKVPNSQTSDSEPAALFLLFVCM